MHWRFTKRGRATRAEVHNPVLISQLYTTLPSTPEWRRNYTAAITFNHERLRLPDCLARLVGLAGRSVLQPVHRPVCNHKIYKAAEKAARDSLSRYIQSRGPAVVGQYRVRMQLARILTAQKTFDEGQSTT